MKVSEVVEIYKTPQETIEVYRLLKALFHKSMNSRDELTASRAERQMAYIAQIEFEKVHGVK